MLALRTLISALVLALGLGAMLFSPLHSFVAGPAWAQDDDDGDDDDDDDDGDDDSDDGEDDSDDDSDDDDSGNGGDDGDDDNDSPFSPSTDDNDDDTNAAPRRTAPVSTPPSPPPPVVDLPGQAPDQIVVEQISPAQSIQLVAEGFAVLDAYKDRTLLRIPVGTSVAQALQIARDVLPGTLAAPNSYYRSQAVPEDCAGDICTHWQAVNWPPASAVCLFAPHIGVVDTGVNVEHDMLREARIDVQTIGSQGAEPSERKHGTAIVAMFVGDGAGRVPGLAPAAQLSVVDPFGRVGTDERSDVFALAQALDQLNEAGVSVVSLSLAGPENPVLAAAIVRLQDRGIPVVAAVGNDGPRAEPLYPAAYEQVIAVTAVDGAGGIYRRAVQGAHVSFAAPGVGIQTAASVSGIRPQTGTSFAVPFVTTAIAAALAAGTPAEEVVPFLAQSSVDLGETGRDPVFGWGLVQLPSPC